MQIFDYSREIVYAQIGAAVVTPPAINDNQRNILDLTMAPLHQKQINKLKVVQ